MYFVPVVGRVAGVRESGLTYHLNRLQIPHRPWAEHIPTGVQEAVFLPACPQLSLITCLTALPVSRTMVICGTSPATTWTWTLRLCCSRANRMGISSRGLSLSNHLCYWHCYHSSCYHDCFATFSTLLVVTLCWSSLKLPIFLLLPALLLMSFITNTGEANLSFIFVPT